MYVCILCKAPRATSLVWCLINTEFIIIIIIIIYINDFPNASRLFNFIMYADDTTLSCTIPRNSSKSQAYLALTEQEQSEPVDKEQSRITRPRRHALKHRCS